MKIDGIPDRCFTVPTSTSLSFYATFFPCCIETCPIFERFSLLIFDPRALPTLLLTLYFHFQKSPISPPHFLPRNSNPPLSELRYRHSSLPSPLFLTPYPFPPFPPSPPFYLMKPPYETATSRPLSVKFSATFSLTNAPSWHFHTPLDILCFFLAPAPKHSQDNRSVFQTLDF